MIKQSEICNFVALIKALKRQINNSPAPAASCDKKSSFLIARKNSHLKTGQFNKISFNRIDMLDEPRNASPATTIAQPSFSEMDIDKRQATFKKKKQLQQRKKRKEWFKFETASMHKTSEIGMDIKLMNWLPNPHHRSYTSQLTVDKQNRKIESGDSEIPKVPENRMKAGWQKNISRRETMKLTEVENIKRTKLDSNLHQILKPRKTGESAQKQKARLRKEPAEGCWVLGAWDQPMELPQQLF